MHYAKGMKTKTKAAVNLHRTRTNGMMIFTRILYLSRITRTYLGFLRVLIVRDETVSTS